MQEPLSEAEKDAIRQLEDAGVDIDKVSMFITLTRLTHAQPTIAAREYVHVDKECAEYWDSLP